MPPLTVAPGCNKQLCALELLAEDVFPFREFECQKFKAMLNVINTVSSAAEKLQILTTDLQLTLSKAIFLAKKANPHKPTENSLNIILTFRT